MSLIPASELLSLLQSQKGAIGAFEPYTFDQTQAIVDAAEQEGAPVILQYWSEVIETWGFPLLMAAVREIAGHASVPVAIHLDHATDEVLIHQALDAGFTSVMFDGSMLPYEENVERTRAVVADARPYGAAVEAELGVIGTLVDFDSAESARESVRSMLTTPEQAVAFVEATGVNILAPAIGSIHGCPGPVAEIDVPRVRAIAEAVDMPLALHGGSGVPIEQTQAAIRAGISKVNVDAEVRGIYIEAIQREIDVVANNPRTNFALAKMPRALRDAVRENVRERIRLLRA